MKAATSRLFDDEEIFIESEPDRIEIRNDIVWADDEAIHEIPGIFNHGGSNADMD